VIAAVGFIAVLRVPHAVRHCCFIRGLVVLLWQNGPSGQQVFLPVALCVRSTASRWAARRQQLSSLRCSAAIEVLNVMVGVF
jgi:hypothetical protein